MPINKEIVGQVIDQSSGVLEKAYDDLAHPTAKSVGNTLSLIPRTIGVWLGKWEKWVINGEESIRLTAQAVQDKASQIPEEKLTEPEPYVAVPTIQQLSYCYDSEELRDMYANLLVSSMNSDTKWMVHPSFVDIIKQLTPDEAKLLRFFSKQTRIPSVDVKVVLTTGTGGFAILKSNCVVLPEGVVENRSNVSMYIDNLVRQKLIDIPYGIFYKDETAYEAVENQEKLADPVDGRIEFNRKILEVTSFGKQFVNICLP